MFKSPFEGRFRGMFGFKSEILDARHQFDEMLWKSFAVKLKLSLNPCLWRGTNSQPHVSPLSFGERLVVRSHVKI